MARKYMFVLCITLIVSISSSVYAGEAQQVVERFLEASGGLDKLLQVKTFLFEAEISAFNYSYSVIFGFGNSYLLVDSNQKAGFDGSDYWVDYKGLVETMPETQKEVYEDLNFYRYFLFGLIGDDGQPVELIYSRKKDKLGKTYHVLKSLIDVKPVRTYFFDSETGLLDKIVEVIEQQDNGEIQQIIRYSDYKKIGELTLFTVFESNDLSNGRALQPRTDVRNMEINPEFESTKFARPATRTSPAIISEGVIQAMILEISDYGSIITNVTSSVLDRARADNYEVTIKDSVSKHRFYEDIRQANIGSGDYVLVFNNTPVLWVVKVNVGMTSDGEFKAGDIISLKPLESVPEKSEAKPEKEQEKADVILLSYDPVTYEDLPELLKAADEKVLVWWR
ncbi:hypothetical protein K8T06_09120 [bacterium]|nr:hypothetical protein [bacterium]